MLSQQLVRQGLVCVGVSVGQTAALEGPVRHEPATERIASQSLVAPKVSPPAPGPSLALAPEAHERMMAFGTAARMCYQFDFPSVRRRLD